MTTDRPRIGLGLYLVEKSFIDAELRETTNFGGVSAWVLLIRLHAAFLVVTRGLFLQLLRPLSCTLFQHLYRSLIAELRLKLF